jgi:hypothetical protein
MSLRRMFEHAEWADQRDMGMTGIENAPAIQRESPPTADEPAAPVASAPTAAPTGASSPTAAGSANVDELATRLYEPLLARLKAELWLDRERAGALTDPRR